MRIVSQKILIRLQKIGIECSKTKKSENKMIIEEKEIGALMERTSMSREQIVNFCENIHVDCPSGFLTKKIFKKYFRELQNDPYKKQKVKKFSRYVFKALDSKSQNQISFGDFLVFYSLCSEGKKCPKKKIELSFKIYDTNKNKKISETNVNQVLEVLHELTGDLISKNDYKEIHKMFEKNKDRVLGLAEFMNVCLNNKYYRKLLIDPMFN